MRRCRSEAASAPKKGRILFFALLGGLLLSMGLGLALTTSTPRSRAAPTCAATPTSRRWSPARRLSPHVMGYALQALRGARFSLTPDPAFLSSAKHREAMAAVRTALGDGRGFITLIGEGKAKTTILYSVSASSDRSRCRMCRMRRTRSTTC
jgi:hypothetical protein